MGQAKSLLIFPIHASDARRIIRSIHYSGTVVPNSQIHLGAFIDGRCGGAMQFGPSLKKQKLVGLVAGTKWNEFIELNRLAFADWLPRNSESRAIGFAFRWMRRQYPHIKWCVSFADATQCGDGAIYRASGFVLTGVKKNNQMAINPATGKPQHKISAYHQSNEYLHAGWKKLPGFQLRYIYFLDPSARNRLTVPILPFSVIRECGASMYRGKPTRTKDQDPALQAGLGGETPTRPLHSPAVAD